MRLPGQTQKHSTPGDFYGCFGPKLSRLDPATKSETEIKTRGKKNFYTSPGPLGGPGYPKITLNPYLSMYGDYEPYEKEVVRKPKRK